MDQTALTDKLMEFGLTRQEASIYLCLAENKELSGYEVSKITGISRSNVYAALQSLVDEGAAYLLEGTTNKYLCVDIEEFCSNRIKNLSDSKDILVREIPHMGNECDGYVTISNYKHIVDKIHFMLNHTEYRIYFATSAHNLELFREDIEKLIKDNKKVVLMVTDDVYFPGSIIYRTEETYMQVRLIVDSKFVLTGDLSGSTNDTCLYSGQLNFVNVFKESLKNEIKLIELNSKTKSEE